MEVHLWKSLKSIEKLYGMSKFAVILAAIGGVLVMIFVSAMACVLGAIVGYFIGDYLSKKMHDGSLQRFLRWHLPGRNKKLPSSDVKFFF